MVFTFTTPPSFTSTTIKSDFNFLGDLPLQEGASNWAKWTPNRPYGE